MGPFCPVQFGTIIRQMREARNWTQDNLSRETGIPQYNICRIECGKRQAKAGEIRSLKEAYHCLYDDFYVVK